MRKYFNKALFFQQWISFRFVMLGITLFWIYYSSAATKSELIASYGQLFYGNDSVLSNVSMGININFTMITYLVLISAIMIMLVMGINKYKKFIFYGGQPLTRSQFIVTNGIFTVIFSVVMVFIDYYIRMLNYLKNRKFYEVLEIDYFKIISIRALILIALILAIIAFFFLIQGLYSNGIVASLIGIGAVYYIPVFIRSMYQNLSYRFWPLKKFLEKILNYINLYYNPYEPDIGFNKFGRWYHEFTSFQFINYQHYLLIIVLIIITSILWIINFRIYDSIKAEKVGAVFHFSICEKIFKAAVAAFSVIITTVVLILIYQIYINITNGYMNDDFEKNILPIFNIISLFMIPVIYKLEGILIKKFVKN